MASLAPETRAYLTLAALFGAVFGVVFGLLFGSAVGAIGVAFGLWCGFVFRHIRRSPIHPSGPLAPFSAREAYRLLGVALTIWLAVGALAFLVWRLSR